MRTADGATVRARGFHYPPALDMHQICARLSKLVPTVVSLSLADPVQAAGRGPETGASASAARCRGLPRLTRCATTAGSPYGHAREQNLHAPRCGGREQPRETRAVPAAPTQGRSRLSPRVVQSRSHAAGCVDTLQRTFLCPSRGSHARGDV